MRAAALIVLLLLATTVMPVHAAEADAGARCAALAGSRFSATLDAPTTVIRARLIAATGKNPTTCAVEGYVAPTNGFGLWLPVDNWNGKYLVRGCGGMCGTVNMELACRSHVREGYACLQTDMGHTSTLRDAEWAYNNPLLVADFGFRSTHVTTLAGKAIAAAFYGKPFAHSYYMGCSTGGRQGLVEAQRFPTDFDGLVVIAPVVNETGTALALMWLATVNVDAAGQAILPVAKLPMLHRAVLARCDMDDRLKDGLIADPRACRFDPADIQCKGADMPECLTAAQVAVVRKIYSGPLGRDGRPLYFGGGALKGSELGWTPEYVLDSGPGSIADFMIDMFRYMTFWPNAGPTWTPKELDLERDAQRLGMMETLFAASNPDLRAFKAAGGKMVMVQGLTDTNVVPGNSFDYYETAVRTMGGLEATRSFFRYFQVPGMNHCFGGEGAYSIKYPDIVAGWVETGKAPDRIVGYHPRSPSDIDLFGNDLPLPQEKVSFSRAYFAYPAHAVYSGKGDPNDAASFRAVMP